uniref:(northern house mosquito) hypothetical protein n=1 Tax=Culex pipiens TaxID=7175 RepID=A0A8D8MFY0_CULPI
MPPILLEDVRTQKVTALGRVFLPRDLYPESKLDWSGSAVAALGTTNFSVCCRSATGSAAVSAGVCREDTASSTEFNSRRNVCITRLIWTTSTGSKLPSWRSCWNNSRLKLTSSIAELIG